MSVCVVCCVLCVGVSVIPLRAHHKYNSQERVGLGLSPGEGWSGIEPRRELVWD